jgi:integrase
MATKVKRTGRHDGRRNKGYWFRAGRGWYRSDRTPLVDASGVWLRERNTPAADLQDAWAASLVRDRMTPQAMPERAARPAIATTADDMTAQEICDRYLTWLKANGSPSTYRMRANFLFDFVTGLPARFRGHPESTKAEREKARIHAGYGGRSVSSLICADVEDWLAAHPAWKGCRRGAIASIKTAFHKAALSGRIALSPFAKCKAGKARNRLTYLSPDQETALLKHAKPAFRIALRVLIRTGMRPGAEFAKCTAKHVKKTPHGLLITFKEHKTSKQTGKPREVCITDAAIIALFEQAMELHPSGPLFRNTVGGAWTHTGLSNQFRRAARRAEREGVELDSDACLYSLRHTYAKRTINGYWTGKPASLPSLAGLLGNTPEVAMKYASAADNYKSALWASA